MALLKFTQFIQEANEELPGTKKRTQRMPKSEAYWKYSGWRCLPERCG